ncbi:unnamed protein product [Clavelina lepadiformis]|uniref:Profilin n=1 Tax=Clavelina lepadiformis TaxID=159417 RepID=A0ABP0GJW0_CLALP
MNWNILCSEILRNGGRTTHYAYLGRLEEKLAEADRRGDFTTLSDAEVALIIEADGSNFRLRDDEYRFVGKNDGIFCYEGTKMSMACGRTSRYVLIVCGSGTNPSRVKNHCLKAVDYGLSSIELMKV